MMRSACKLCLGIIQNLLPRWAWRLFQQVYYASLQTAGYVHAYSYSGNPSHSKHLLSVSEVHSQQLTLAAVADDQG